LTRLPRLPLRMAVTFFILSLSQKHKAETLSLSFNHINY
jgi:hypothetical protein